MAKKWPLVLVGLIGFGMISNACDDDKPSSKSVTSVTTTTKRPSSYDTSYSTTYSAPRTTTPVAVAPAPLLAPVDTYVPTTTPYVPAPAPAPAYTPTPEYTPPQSTRTQSSSGDSVGTVHPGSFCSGGTGVTTKGTPMVCAEGSDGRMRWKSAG